MLTLLERPSLMNLPKINDPELGRFTHAVLKPATRVKLIPGDCLEILSDLTDYSIHMVLSSPPHFQDQVDSRGTDCLDKEKEQSETLALILEQLYRIIKPGGFVLIFITPRLVHRAMLPLEKAGFELYDHYAWRFTRRTESNAIVSENFDKVLRSLEQVERKEILKSIGGRKATRLRAEFESIVCAQKPREGTFVNNWIKHEVGLVDTKQTLKGTAPSNVMTVEKETKANPDQILLSIPLRICEHLIRLFSKEGQVVLDPFLDNGTSCVAAYKSRRHSIGIDSNLDHIGTTKQRIEEMLSASQSPNSPR